MLEREIKLRLSTPGVTAQVLHRLIMRYGAPMSEVHQRDEYYDRNDGLLAREDFVVRLRVVDRTSTFFALKGKRVFCADGSSERIELEFEYAEEKEIRRQLAAQGFGMTAVYEKKRIEWRLEDRTISIDTLPILGDFLEIEVRGVESIESAMSELGVIADWATERNYSELLKETLLARGIPVPLVLRAEF